MMRHITRTVLRLRRLSTRKRWLLLALHGLLTVTLVLAAIIAADAYLLGVLNILAIGIFCACTFYGAILGISLASPEYCEMFILNGQNDRGSGSEPTLRDRICEFVGWTPVRSFIAMMGIVPLVAVAAGIYGLGIYIAKSVPVDYRTTVEFTGLALGLLSLGISPLVPGTISDTIEACCARAS